MENTRSQFLDTKVNLEAVSYEICRFNALLSGRGYFNFVGGKEENPLLITLVGFKGNVLPSVVTLSYDVVWRILIEYQFPNPEGVFHPRVTLVAETIDELQRKLIGHIDLSDNYTRFFSEYLDGIVNHFSPGTPF